MLKINKKEEFADKFILRILENGDNYNFVEQFMRITERGRNE